MAKRKSIFPNSASPKVLSHYTYLYFMRPSIFSPSYVRSLLVFNRSLFSKSRAININKKISHVSKQYGTRIKVRRTSPYRHTGCMYGLKPYCYNTRAVTKYRRKCGITVKSSAKLSRYKKQYRKYPRDCRLPYVKYATNIKLRSGSTRYNKFMSMYPKCRSQCRSVRGRLTIRKHSPAIRYFVHNLFKRKRPFFRKSSKPYRLPMAFNMRSLVLLRKYLRFNKSKSSIRSAFKYLHGRIFFFQYFLYLYRMCLSMYQSIRCIRKRAHLLATPQPYKRLLSEMVHYLVCTNFVQNIFVNSKIGKLGKPDRTRDIWRKIAAPITRLADNSIYHKDKKPLSMIIGYIKISERFSKYMKYLLKYLVIVNSFLKSVVDSIGNLNKLAKYRFGTTTNAPSVRCSNVAHRNVLKFLPVIFRDFKYIYRSICKRFRSNKSKIKPYDLRSYIKQIRIVRRIKGVLRRFCMNFMPKLLPHKPRNKASYSIKRQISLSVLATLAKTYLTYRIYQFFNSLFLFTCSYHSSADNYYLSNGVDVFRYNYLLSCSNGGVQVVKNYCSEFLRNSDLNYNLVIRTSRSNCSVALLVNNKVVYSSSCGKIGFLKTNRSTYFAANQLGFFLCLFLSSVYGLYLRSSQSQFRPVYSKYLLRYLRNSSYRKFVMKYRMFRKRQRKFYSTSIYGRKKRIRARRVAKFRSLHRYLFKCRRQQKCLRTTKGLIRSHLAGTQSKSRFLVKSASLCRARLQQLARYRNRFISAWSDYCVYLLLRQRAMRRYNFNTSIASIKLNIHMAGTGIGRLAIRKPIRRFVNMIRRATNGGRFFDRSIEASDVRYMGINQLDDSDYLNGENDPYDAVTSDSDGCNDTVYNHGSEVHSFNTDELDSIVASSKYFSEHKKALSNNAASRHNINMRHIVGSKFSKCSTMVNRRRTSTSMVPGTCRPNLCCAHRQDNSILDMVGALKVRSILRSFLCLMCLKLVSLYQYIQFEWVSISLHVFKRYLLKNTLLLYSRAFILLIFHGYSSLPHIPTAIFSIVCRPVPGYIGVLLCIERYISSLMVLRLFLSTLSIHGSYGPLQVGNYYRFCTTVIYIYLYLVHRFMLITANLIRKQRGILLSCSLMHILSILLNGDTAIELYLYDVLAVLFSIFFKQVRRLLIVAAYNRHMIHKKHMSMVSAIFATHNSASCYAQGKLHKYLRWPNKTGLLVLYNNKTVSVPHNGCRARKMRRK